jgi:hypothetical protein
MLANRDFEIREKEVLVTEYEILLRNLSGGTEENHKKVSQDSRSPGWV